MPQFVWNLSFRVVRLYDQNTTQWVPLRVHHEIMEDVVCTGYQSCCMDVWMDGWMDGVYAFVVFAEPEVTGPKMCLRACSLRCRVLVIHDQVNAVDATASSPRGYGGDGRAVDVACSDLEFVRLQRLSYNRRICFDDEVSSVRGVVSTPFQHAYLSWSLRNWFVLPRIYRCTEADDSGEARRGLGVGGGAR